MSSLTLKPHQMQELIIENYNKQKHALFFEGSPGIGKTAVVENCSNILRKDYKNFILRTIILSQYESVDLRGIPSILTKEKQTTVWNPPHDLTFKEDDCGIIFFDELPNATQDVQKASQQLIHSGRLGDLVMPKGFCFLAAGNRVTDRAGANRMLTALANRFEHHSVEAHVDDWSRWAIGAGKIEHVVISFVNQFVNHFNDFKAERTVNATPRSWEKVSNVLGSKFELERIYGIVGEGIGAEFVAYTRLWRELPRREDIYKEPKKVPIPTKKDIQYAITMSLALSADKGNYNPSMDFVERMSKEWQVLFLKSASMANKELSKEKRLRDWLSKNQEIIVG